MTTLTVNGTDINVSNIRNDWALALMTQGVIVKLSTSWWRAQSPLKAEELGIKFVDDDTMLFMKKYIRLGSECLLPPSIISEIQSIDTKARDNLREYSFDTIWGKFVPYTAFPQWHEKDKIIRNDFFEAAHVLMEKHDDIIEIVKTDYRKMARDVWNRLYKDNSPTESFIENFVSNIVKKIPSKISIFNSFKYESTYFIIPLPSLLEEEVSMAQEIKQQKEMRLFNYELEKETKKRISEEYLKKRQEYIDGFLESTVSNMRLYVAELCDTIIQSINGNDNNDLSKKQREKIKSMIKKVKTLNFYDDTEINKMMMELETEVDKFKGDRNKDLIVSKLQSVVDMGHEQFVPANFNPIISNLDI